MKIKHLIYLLIFIGNFYLGFNIGVFLEEKTFLFILIVSIVAAIDLIVAIIFLIPIVNYVIENWNTKLFKNK